MGKPVLVSCLCAALAAGAGQMAFDFESGKLDGWRVVAGGSGGEICSWAFENNRKTRPYTKQGKYFLSTLTNAQGRPSDALQMTIESPSVRFEDGRISMRVGGGSGAGVYVAVCANDGTELARFRGRNDETMFPVEVDLPAIAGRDGFFRVVDAVAGSWCHVTVDDIRFNGRLSPDGDRARREAAVRRVVLSGRAALEKAIDEFAQKDAAYPAADLKARLAAAVNAGDVPAFEKVRLDALVRHNPLLDAEICYVTHAQYAKDHHNTATLFQPGEINARSYRTQGAMKALDARTGRVRAIVPEEKGRTVRDPEVDADGRRIVFSMRSGREDSYHVFTVNADGSDLRQLTRSTAVSDVDPVWLPDGDIVFTSTREPKYCMCNRHIMGNLYRMKPNGANVYQIGRSTLFEGHSTVLPDGRVLYDRWEYVDRNFGDAQGLWTCFPDGTGHAIYWGNNTTSPGGVINARAMPDGKVVAVLGSCHERPWGCLGIIDRTKGVDGREPVIRTWPAEFRERIHTDGQDFDSTGAMWQKWPYPHKYADPFPIDSSHFLAVRAAEGTGEETALIYFDLFGNEIEIHRDAPGVHSPILLKGFARQHVQPTRRSFDDPKAPGYFYLQNVYEGTHMKGVEKGSIKSLRIVESPEKRSWSPARGWFGHGEEAAAMNWHSFENKRILGTVPVEADGSAYFEVPANTFVYFQALDGEGKMVQSMRSGAYVQPGETYGCVGCHEDRLNSASPRELRPKAMTRRPDKMNGWRGPARMFSYQRDVQPIFTAKCLSCHDYGKKAAAKLNLAGDRDTYFCTSYVDLWSQGFVTLAGGGRAEIYPAYSWGSHASRLTKKLYGHGGVTLTDEERDTIVTWMDLNGVYYPFYECAYPANYGGRSPLTKDEHARLEKLTGVTIECSHGKRQRAQIAYERPECSRILEGVKGKAEYAEALAIIRTGTERLKATPRADMDGFVPCAADQKREVRYQSRADREREIYSAIREGRELFD